MKFIRSILLNATIVWIVVTVIQAFVMKWRGVPIAWSHLSWGAAVGISFSLPASIVLRHVCLNFPSLVPMRWLAFIILSLAFAFLWYATASAIGADAIRDGLIWKIPIVALTFAAPYPAKIFFSNRRRERLERSWRTRPKVGIGPGPFSLVSIGEQLSQLAEGLKGRLVEDRRRVEAFRETYNLGADSRLSQLLPIGEAIDFVVCNAVGVFCCSPEDGRWRLTTNRKTATKELRPKIAPIVLIAALRFLFEYGLRFTSTVRLHLTVNWGKQVVIQIATNIPAGDLWFQLPHNGAALTAKGRFVETLDRFFQAQHQQFEFRSNSSGQIEFCFRTSAAPEISYPDWELLEREVGSDLETLSECVFSAGMMRVFRRGELIYKVARGEHRGWKLASLEDEWRILSALRGVAGVPQAIGFSRTTNFTTLTMRRIAGVPIDQHLASVQYSKAEVFRCIAGISSVLERIHQKGVIHRDLMPRNVLVAADGTVALIDFDQAIGNANPYTSVDLEGNCREVPTHCSFKDLIKQLGVQDTYEAAAEKLSVAWRHARSSDASSPGVEIAYYDFLFGYRRFAGERSWTLRWDLLEPVLREIVPGAKVLELGCNMGLLSTHCALLGGDVLGVDCVETILDAARCVADAAGVKPRFVRGDLSDAAFVARLAAEKPRVIFALSVLHWLQERQPVYDLISSAEYLFYEGHDPTTTEVALLGKLGFTEIRILGYSERLRAIYFGHRQ